MAAGGVIIPAINRAIFGMFTDVDLRCGIHLNMAVSDADMKRGKQPDCSSYRLKLLRRLDYGPAKLCGQLRIAPHFRK